jgi:hypothetical protein
MKGMDAIEAEIKALNLVRSVVDDAAFEQALDFVTLALSWVIEEESKDNPSTLIADQYKDRRKFPPSLDDMKASDKPTLVAPVSQGKVTLLMEIDGNRFVVPPFPWRDLDEENDLLHEYLKEFVENLKTYVENVFGQVTVKEA